MRIEIGISIPVQAVLVGELEERRIGGRLGIALEASGLAVIFFNDLKGI